MYLKILFSRTKYIFNSTRKSSDWYHINRIINETEWNETYSNVYETGLYWGNLQIPTMENNLFNAMERESLKGANGFQIFTFATQIQHTTIKVLLLH